MRAFAKIAKLVLKKQKKSYLIMLHKVLISSGREALPKGKAEYE
jgi:hypothetical protein